MEIDELGWIKDLKVGTSDVAQESFDQIALPGMTNVHSHAFQRAFAGSTEYRIAERDSFWTWREKMFEYVRTLTPEQVYEIAKGLYAEMLMADTPGSVSFITFTGTMESRLRGSRNVSGTRAGRSRFRNRFLLIADTLSTWRIRQSSSLIRSISILLSEDRFLELFRLQSRVYRLIRNSVLLYIR